MREHVELGEPCPPHPNDVQDEENQGKKFEDKKPLAKERYTEIHEAYQEWKRNDAKARSIMADMLSSKYIDIFRTYSTTHDLWSSLGHHFARTNFFLEASSRQKLVNMRLNDATIGGDIEL